MCWNVHNVHFCIHLHIHVFFREHACVCISMCISAFAMSHVQCVCACAMCYVPCAMFHVSCAMWCACLHVPCALFQCHQSRGRWNQSIASSKPLHRYPPPLLLIIPQPFLHRENLWHDELILVCHIISVTFSSFKMAEGILNHDIFLFVPNISTKALPPWQKYQQKISLGSIWPNLFIQFTKIQST